LSAIRGIFAVGLLCLAVAPALAGKPEDRGPTPGLGWGEGGSKSFAVPSPVAGVGLPVLIGVGGYIWLIERKRRRKGQKATE
jgi:hypothetical protein